MRHLAIALVALMACSTEQESATTGTAQSAAPTASAKPTIAEVPVTAKSPEALAIFNRAFDLELNTRHGDAIVELKKALEKDPDFALALAWLGELTPGAEGMAKLDQAVALAAKLPEAERLTIEELKARRAGDLEKARELSKKIVAIAPFDWRAQLDLGNRFLDERKFDDASVAFGKAAAFGPKVPAIYNSLGYSYLMQHKVDAAVGAFRKYSKLAPDEPNALDSLGEALMMAGKLREAEDSFSKAVSMGAPYAWGGVAYTKFFRGEWGPGMAALDKAREGALLPEDKLDTDVMAIYALLAQKKIADANKRIDQLEKDADRAKADEAYASVPVYRAVALAEDGKDQDAVKEIAHAYERLDKAKLPGVGAARVRRLALGWRAMFEGRSGTDAAKTAADLEEEAKRSPADPDQRSRAALGRGAAALSKGDAAGAAHQLADCLAEDFLCRWLLLVAEEKAGDSTGADLTRDAIATMDVRDPAYVYVRSHVAAPTH